MKLDQAVSEFLTYLTVDKGFSNLTVRNYEHYMWRFVDWVSQTLPAIVPEQINMDMVRGYRLFLARFQDNNGRVLKKTTQGYHLIALRMFLRYLSVNRGLDVMPADRVELPKQESRSVKFLSTDEVDRLIREVKYTGNNDDFLRALRDRTILETLFSTGMRVSELIALNRDDIDLVRKEFTVIGKGNKPRVVFLSDECVTSLKRYLKERKDVYKPLFIRLDKRVRSLSEVDMRLGVRAVQRIVKKYAKKAGLRISATPHTLRHSFATDLLREGADIRSVQTMLGHASIISTQVYTHVTDKHLRDVHSKYHAKNRGGK